MDQDNAAYQPMQAKAATPRNRPFMKKRSSSLQATPASAAVPELDRGRNDMMTAQKSPETDVMEQPFFCMGVLQFIPLAVFFIRHAHEAFLRLLIIYSAFDISCIVLLLVHRRIRGTRPVLSRTTKILVVLSPIYMPVLALIVRRCFR
jgi:hypothetical protein